MMAGRGVIAEGYRDLLESEYVQSRADRCDRPLDLISEVHI